MSKVKVNELSGAALDYAVARCEGKNGMLHDDGITRCIVIVDHSGLYRGTWRPSTEWAQGGPIIEQEGISIKYLEIVDLKNRWMANTKPTITKIKTVGVYGPEPLIAAMRCYVVSKLGEEIELPNELMMRA